MSKAKNLIPLIIILLAGVIEANSRVAFSRPGNMMRVPSVDSDMYKNLLAVNVSSEYLSSSQSSSAFSVNTLAKSGYLYGISFVKPVNPANSAELGFHLQKNMVEYGDVKLDVGIQDVILRQGSDIEDADGLDTKGVSLFAVLSSAKHFEDYAIATHLGFGSGKINEDSHLYVSNPKQNIGVFLGFNFTTPFLKKNGGINFLTEFDGKGLNIGVIVPILKSTYINLGITHFENFGDFATEDRTGTDRADLSGGAPSITFGMGINVPRIFDSDEAEELSKQLGDGIYGETDSSILYYDPICTDVVETLRDSIKVSNNMIDNLNDYNNMLQHKEVVLIDSTRKNLLREQVNQSNQNKAMRHLSRSLRFFYDEQFRNALSEVNSAIELNPHLAIAYGRRGSIYYKLGDNRRATLNWNVALQLDPEFTEIYDMLQAADENRLIPVEIGKTQENIK
jgi:hypothetical protein